METYFRYRDLSWLQYAGYQTLGDLFHSADCVDSPIYWPVLARRGLENCAYTYCLLSILGPRSLFLYLAGLRPRTVHHLGPNSCPQKHSSGRRDLPFGISGWGLGVFGLGFLGLGGLVALSSIKFDSIICASCWEIVRHCLCAMREIYSYDRDGIVTSPPDIWLLAGWQKSPA